MNPIVAVLLGAGFAGETLSVRTLIAAGLIIGSVALVITAQQLKPKAVPLEAVVAAVPAARLNNAGDTPAATECAR